jgi:hypothetical protein
VLAWLDANSALLTVCGALLIFFSWMVANTAKSSLQRLTDAMERVDERENLDYQFDDLRHAIGSIGVQTYVRRGDSAPHDSRKYWEALDMLVETGMNSSQVDHLNALARRECRRSEASKIITSTAIDIRKVSARIFNLYRDLRNRLDSLHSIVNATHSKREDREGKETAIAAIHEFDEYYRSSILIHVQPLSEELVSLINIRKNELRVELDGLRRRASFVNRVALFVYAVGSLAAIAGQMGDKLI